MRQYEFNRRVVLQSLAGVAAAAVAGRIPGLSVAAASSTLARQIERGAPADIYLSANVAWMDYLAAHGLIELASLRNLLGNRLVLIAHRDSDLELSIQPGMDLAALLGRDRLAIGDPDHVPAGIYAREALEALGIWTETRPRLAPSADVRGALVLVARGETPLGIVYASDAGLSAGVRTVAVFPERLHAPIVYPVALVAGRDSALARRFLRYLHSAAAKAIFARHGFLTDCAACSR